MKRFFRFTAIAVMATMMCATAQAQGEDKQNDKREQKVQARALRMADRLALDDATTKKFVATYSRCREEMREIKPQRAMRRHMPMSDAETDKAIKDRFERSQKMLDLKRKYYAEYSKFLTPKQIRRIYAMDKQGKKHGAKRLHKKRMSI